MNQYVLCDVTYGLVLTLEGTSGRSHQKTLGDLQVTLGKGAVTSKDIMDSADDCRDHWLELLKNEGGSHAPLATVKGENDPNRPMFGRRWWAEGDGGSVLGNVREAYLRRMYAIGKYTPTDQDDMV
jgi:hypothetical protein